MRMWLFLILILMLNFASPVNAARDGKASANSVATVGVSLSIPKIFRAQMEPNLVFDSSTSFTNVAITSNYGLAASNYHIIASGIGENGAFILRGEDNQRVPFSVFYQSEGRPHQSLHPNLAVDALSASLKLNEPVKSVAKIGVSIPKQIYAQVERQSLTGTLIVVFLPN